MDLRSPRDLQHLALPTAAALVYFGVTGMTLDATNAQWMRSVIDDIAHAMAVLVPVYSMLPDGKHTVVSRSELLGARFDRGAHLLVTRSGTHLKSLTVQRKDLLEAIAILKASRVSF